MLCRNRNQTALRSNELASERKFDYKFPGKRGEKNSEEGPGNGRDSGVADGTRCPPAPEFVLLTNEPAASCHRCRWPCLSTSCRTLMFENGISFPAKCKSNSGGLAHVPFCSGGRSEDAPRGEGTGESNERVMICLDYVLCSSGFLALGGSATTPGLVSGISVRTLYGRRPAMAVLRRGVRAPPPPPGTGTDRAELVLMIFHPKRNRHPL